MKQTLRVAIAGIAVLLLLLSPSLFASTFTYEYDALDRLIQVTYEDGTVVHYSYDPAGNRTQRVVSAATTTLNVNVVGEGSGTVTSEPSGINCGDSCTAEFTSGVEVTLTALPEPDSTFDGWAGACSGASSTCIVRMDLAEDVTATFSGPPPGPDPDPPVIDDGVVYCDIGCEEEVSDDGTRMVVFEEQDPETGTKVRLEAVLPDSAGDVLRHRLRRTLSDGTETLTEAVSELPDSTVTLERDEDGRPRIVTLAVLNGVMLEVLARADGSAEHWVSTEAGESVVGTDVPGAFTRFTPEGRVETFLEFPDGLYRAVALTDVTGEGHTRFDSWDAQNGEWVLESRTIDDTVSVFEVNHRVWIEPDAGDGLGFDIETWVTRDLYF